MVATRQALLTIATCGLMVLTGCVKYTPKSKTAVAIKASQYVETQNNITVTVKKLIPNNYNIFTKKKLFRRYVPIEITFSNKGNTVYKISRNYVGTPLVAPDKIARNLHNNPLVSLIWPFAVIDPLKMHILAAAIIIGKHAANPYAIAISLPLAISTIYSLTHKENKNITKNFWKNSTDLRDALYIQAKEQMTKIVYIKKDYFKPKFYIVAINTLTGSKSHFDVNLE